MGSAGGYAGQARPGSDAGQESNPVATAGLKGQSCAHARIEWGNPAPTTGLTAGPRQSRTPRMVLVEEDPQVCPSFGSKHDAVPTSEAKLGPRGATPSKQPLPCTCRPPPCKGTPVLLRTHPGLCGGTREPVVAVEDGTLSLEGVFQMAYVLPERLLALVRPAFDLVLRRIRSLKRCVQACGCKIMTPRYACNLAPGCISSEPTFAGLRKTKKKKTRGPKKRGPRKKGKRGFLWQSLTSLEMQPGAKLQRISRGHYFAATRLHAAF